MAAIETCFADRPQHLGSLVPKPDGLPVETLITPDFVTARAAAIVQRLAEVPAATAPRGAPPAKQRGDTTHLSTLDAEGATVAFPQKATGWRVPPSRAPAM